MINVNNLRGTDSYVGSAVLRKKITLSPFQILDCFNKSRYINFATYLNIVVYLNKHYILIHGKNYLSRFAKTIYKVERRE